MPTDGSVGCRPGVTGGSVTSGRGQAKALAVLDVGLQVLRRHHVLGRFWKSARGFWRGPTARLAWGLVALLVVITGMQLLVQYRLNLWNRDFFNALELRDGGEIWHQTHLLALFASLSIGLAVTAVWGRMTFQRSWRAWVSRPPDCRLAGRRALSPHRAVERRAPERRVSHRRGCAAGHRRADRSRDRPDGRGADGRDLRGRALACRRRPRCRRAGRRTDHPGLPGHRRRGLCGPDH